MSNPLLSVRRMVVLLGALAILMLGSSLLATRSSATSAPYPPSTGCTLSVAPGDSGVTGSGFASGAPVSVTVNGSNASITANSDGSFTMPLHPTSDVLTVLASSDGTHCGLGTGSQQVGPRHSPSTPPASASSSGGGSVLASTGFQAATASVIAIVLLAGGIFLVVIGRRRRV